MHVEGRGEVVTATEREEGTDRVPTPVCLFQPFQRSPEPNSVTLNIKHVLAKCRGKRIIPHVIITQTTIISATTAAKA